MKKAVLYARESPSLAENELTIDSQKSAVIERIEQDTNILMDTYPDNGYAGDLLARPELDRLRDDAAQHKFDIVYIFDRDRLARKYALQELVLAELEELGIEVVFLMERKAENAEDKIMLGIRGIFAEYEREKIKERTRRGRLHRAKNGLLVGSVAPYGYRYVRPDKDKDERWYEIVDEEAKIVKMIFEWVGNEGCSLMEVRRRLHKQEIQASKSGKTVWANSTLSRLLRRSDYIGTTYYNKTLAIIPEKSRTTGYKRMKKTGRVYKEKSEWLPIEIPTIVDPELFARTQEQLKRNAFFNKRNQKSPYLLSGLLFCGCGCDTRMAGDGQGKYSYYRSTDRIRQFPEKRICTQYSTPKDKIDTVVWNKLVKALNDPGIILQQLQNLTENKKAEQKRLTEQLLKLEKEFEKLEIEEERIASAFRKGLLPEQQLTRQMQEIEKERKQIQKRKTEIVSQPIESDVEVTPEKLARYRELMKKDLSEYLFEEKQELLRLLVNKVIVKGKQLTIQGEIPIDTLDLNDNSSSKTIGNKPIASTYGNTGYVIPLRSNLHYRWSP